VVLDVVDSMLEVEVVDSVLRDDRVGRVMKSIPVDELELLILLVLPLEVVVFFKVVLVGLGVIRVVRHEVNVLITGPRQQA
jgi:hypothetical protein